MVIQQVKQTSLNTNRENFFTPGDDIYQRIAWHNTHLSKEAVERHLKAGEPVYTSFSKWELIWIKIPS